MKKYTVKLFIFYMIFLLTFNLCSCSKAPEPIALTMANYADYLEIDGTYTTAKASGDGFWHGSDHLIPDISTTIEVKGASNNFIYNDVEVVVEISGTYKAFANQKDFKGGNYDFYKIFHIKCNKGGNGSSSSVEKSSGYTTNKFMDLSIDVIDVSGSVIEAN